VQDEAKEFFASKYEDNMLLIKGLLKQIVKEELRSRVLTEKNGLTIVAWTKSDPSLPKLVYCRRPMDRDSLPGEIRRH
jgi:hypothetical protein